MTNSTKNAVKLFYSYSHKDEEIRKELEKHLSILKRQNAISEWHDRKILGGEEWEKEINQELQSASIILLLVSSDFLASDYCYGKELEMAMKRHEEGDARVIPIIIRSVDWEGAPFGKLQAFPKDAKAVTSWIDRDEAFTNIAQGIRSSIAQIKLKAEPRETTSDISDLLKKIKLRPKKYAGKEIIAEIKIKSEPSPISSNDAQLFNLPLGDAILRKFNFTNPDIKNFEQIYLYAQDKNADWLENVPLEKSYKVRLYFLFKTDSYTSQDPLTGEVYEIISSHKGYKLIEVIDETK